jgi:branched-chain amino acid transport system ATP-binding protein
MLALGETFRIVFTNWESVTAGAVGIITSRTWGAEKLPYYYIALAIAALSIYVAYRLIRSKYGYYFVSIREDQDAAEGLGIPTTRYKLYALIPSAFFTGLAGAVFMNYIAYIEPHLVFNLSAISIMMILAVMLGGAGSLWGPVLGAAIYTILSEALRAAIGPISYLVFPIIACLIIMFLDINHVVRRFGGLVAVDDITVGIEQGEIFGLIGPNGSGKTTLFNCINNYHPANSGEILFKGIPITRSSTHEICRLGIGRTFQVVKPLRRMTVLENVMAGAFLRTDSVTKARDKATEVLDFCELLHRKDMLAKDLPIADKKRIEIARSLAGEPELMLLDETAAGLNPKEIEAAMAIVKKIRDGGVTCFVVEHVMKFIMGISDRMMCINFGREIARGTPEEIASHPEVIKAYLGEEYVKGR